MATSLDDYLWIKLSQIRCTDDAGGALDASTASASGHPSTDVLTLPQFQHMMLEEYGETHFNAYEEPVLYFQVMWLP